VAKGKKEIKPTHEKRNQKNKNNKKKTNFIFIKICRKILIQFYFGNIFRDLLQAYILA